LTVPRIISVTESHKAVTVERWWDTSLHEKALCFSKGDISCLVWKEVDIMKVRCLGRGRGIMQIFLSLNIFFESFGAEVFISNIFCT